MVAYKQRCSVCKNAWALVTSRRQRFAVCMDCEMKAVAQEVNDKKFAKLFDIPLEWYKENSFLRSIRYQYGRYRSLTQNQVEAFKKTIKEMKDTGKR